MKPTVEEQLQGTCRILESVVAPCVADPYARTILDGLIANLRMVTGALPAVPGFLRHDNQATLRLLAALRDAVPRRSRRTHLPQALEEPEPEATDAAAARRAQPPAARAAAQAVCSEGLAPEQHRAIVQHMTERASRMPMRYVATAPSQTPTAKT